MKEARRITQENRCLLIWDEIQTGLGRTGKLFAYQHEDHAKPDLLILGKALSGGAYPVSAVVGSREVLGLFKPGEHGSTYGGNPLGSAVAHEALRVLVEEELVENSARLGLKLQKELDDIAKKSSLVQEVRVRGLWAGIEIKPQFGKAREYCLKLCDQGILAKDTRDQVIRIAPPLVLREEEFNFLIKGLKEVLLSNKKP
jgi:ornithine--oxo-acid transaminase